MCYYIFLLTLLGSYLNVPNFLHGLNITPQIPRIVNGQDGKIEDFPYVVRLYHKNVICSGAIINAAWVLTAAHCIGEGLVFEVQAGFDDVNSNTMQKRKPIKTILHEFYEGDDYDVALIQVRPFELSKTVSPVPLSNEMWPQGKQMYNVPCVAAGWGLEETRGKPSRKLQKLDVIARHGEDGCLCNLPYQNKRLVCISGKTGKGICPGDSGSVLVCNKKAVGVAHVGYLEDVCDPFRIQMPEFSCEQAVSAYIYICPLLDWIHKQVPQVPTSPVSCIGCKRQSSTLTMVIVSNILLKSHL